MLTTRNQSNTHSRTHIFSSVVAIIFLPLVTGCIANYHYRAFLLDAGVIACPQTSIPVNYTLQMDNAIPIEGQKRITVSIPQVRVGFTHRNPNKFSSWGWDSKRGPYANEFSVEGGLGGRDFWLLTEIIGLDHDDPLGLKQTKIFRASYIKQDQLSYGFLELEAPEQVVFDSISNTSYEVTVKLYSVHAPDIKKTLYTLGNTTVFGTAWNAASGLATATGNFLAKELLDSLSKEAKQDPMLIERVLLKSSAELEISGTFHLVLNADSQPACRDYLLYDIVKSHLDRDANGELDEDSKASIKTMITSGHIVITDDKGKAYTAETLPKDALLTLPRSQDEYEHFFRTIHSFASYTVETPSQLLNGLTAGPSLTRDQLARSYIRIHVSTAGASSPTQPKVQ